MKITSVEIQPEGSSSIVTLSFRDPRRINAFNVRGITGLDADEIIPRYYGVSGDKKFYNLSMEKRQPIIQIEFNPNYSLNQSNSDLRDQIYKMIASSRTGMITLRFLNGIDVVAALSGFVSKVENSLFNKIQGVSITIDCREPLLKAPSPTIVDILTLNIASSNIQDLKSTAPHGFIFRIGFLSAIAALTVFPDDNSWTFSIEPVGGFLSGDVLHFSSELNNKYLYVVRGGNTIYLADSIEPGSIWPIIFPGDNVFEFADPTALTWDFVSYYPTYWGV